MPFNEHLAHRIRSILSEHCAFEERRMFGGLAFMVNGHMCCGIVGEDLMVRVGPAAYQEALAKPHARPMDFTGRPSKGMVYVGPAGHRSAVRLKEWLDYGHRFVLSLPPKEK